MTLLDSLPKKAILGASKLYSLIPTPTLSDPVFIIGCGRSGTTILGSSLSKHSKIKYLNEPRKIWFSAFPEADIWSKSAGSRGGKLWLDKNDYRKKKSLRLGRMFKFMLTTSKKEILVEKLPANNFRLELINEIFPDARFIHIYRNGLDVAKSINAYNEGNRGNWFGRGSYKWKMLVEYAKKNPETKSLPDICKNHYDKGLLEWRLSTEAAVSFLIKLPNHKYTEINYDYFIEKPDKVISGLMDFLEVKNEKKVTDFVSQKVQRKTQRSGRTTPNHNDLLLGGHLLEKSLATSPEGITSLVINELAKTSVPAG